MQVWVSSILENAKISSILMIMIAKDIMYLEIILIIIIFSEQLIFRFFHLKDKVSFYIKQVSFYINAKRFLFCSSNIITQNGLKARHFRIWIIYLHCNSQLNGQFQFNKLLWLVDKTFDSRIWLVKIPTSFSI